MEIAILPYGRKEKRERHATCGGTTSINHVGKASSVAIKVQTLLMALEFVMIHGNLETYFQCVTPGSLDSELQAALTNLNASISLGSDSISESDV